MRSLVFVALVAAPALSAEPGRIGLSNEVSVRYKRQASFKGLLPRFVESFSLTDWEN